MLNKSKILVILFVFITLITVNYLSTASTINYKVKPNDNLSSLAARYNTSIAAIKNANNLYNDTIYTNDNLVIPTASSFTSFTWPVKGRISSGYGYRIHPIKGTRHMHAGIDIAVPMGTKIRASAPGTIVWSGWVNGFGRTIMIDHHNGYKTLYAHNSKLLVNSGQQINTSQVIALAGSTGRSTGSHLDFRIYLNGEEVNPMDYLS